MRYPAELERHADTLAHAELPDPRFAVLVDALDDGTALETANLATILVSRGMVTPDPVEYASLPLGVSSALPPRP